jgi:Tfp pilus assembly protein PilV
MKAEDGLTIIETLIAVAVFSIGLLAIINMQISSRKISSQAMNMTKAINLANHKIEELISLEYDDSMIKDNNTDIGSFTEYIENNVDNGYDVQWKVDDNSPMHHTKTIIVSVLWMSADLQKQVIFEIIKAKI